MELTPGYVVWIGADLLYYECRNVNLPVSTCWYFYYTFRQFSPFNTTRQTLRQQQKNGCGVVVCQLILLYCIDANTICAIVNHKTDIPFNGDLWPFINHGDDVCLNDCGQWTICIRRWHLKIRHFNVTFIIHLRIPSTIIINSLSPSPLCSSVV